MRTGRRSLVGLMPEPGGERAQFWMPFRVAAGHRSHGGALEPDAIQFDPQACTCPHPLCSLHAWCLFRPS